MARVVVPGLPHHVVQRGVRSLDVFFSDADRAEYLGLLADCGSRRGLVYWAWCLMSNHVHLLVVPAAADSLARTLGEAHRRYTRMVNFRQKVRGHLFQERFHSYPIQRDGHLLAAARYVERNPVRAGLVVQAEEWRWSSAAYNAGAAESDALLDARRLPGMFGSWRRLLAAEQEGIAAERLERHLRTGRPLGGERWVRRLEAELGRPLAPRKGGRPPKQRAGRGNN
jgi:putative transposase